MPYSHVRALCWIRRDLRISDHAALAAATAKAGSVAMVFVFDTVILDALRDKADKRLTFIYKSLVELDEKLRLHGSRLIVLHGDPVSEIPKLAKQLEVDAVFTARDYEPYAIKRDGVVAERLKEFGVQFVSEKDTVLKEGGEVFSAEGRPLRVYSPYRRAWTASLVAERDTSVRVPDLAKLWSLDRLTEGVPQEIPTLESIGFEEAELWLEPGENAARRRLQKFSMKMDAYAERRNFPAEPSTSTLSVDLRFGTISVRQMARAALSRDSAGATSWLSEIVWRDFYNDILYHFPHVAESPFQPMYDGIEYPGLDEHFEAWCRGETGYPIIDAAMRCLNQTGWMHNRLRMVVASFLTKDLLIDYRRGESYFAEKLLDFDLASNNGGWQWSASVGADPQPYFRIFNPLLQSEKFDPDAVFIRTWLPELAGLDAKAIHCPERASEFDRLASGVVLGENYPYPIVEHSVQKDKAIALLERHRSTGKIGVN